MTSRAPVVAALLALLAVPIQAKQAGDADPEAVFDAFWSLYDENYALFDTKRVDWQAVRSIYRPHATRATSRAALFEVFSEALDRLNDVHVTVRDEEGHRFSRSGGRSIGIGEFENGKFSQDLIMSRYVEGGLMSRVRELIQFGEMRRGVGYLRIRNFKYPTSTGQAVDEALAELADRRALVIDVRNNGGGADSVGRIIANRFADRPRLYMRVSHRIGGIGRGTFAPPVDWQVEPQGGRRFEGRVIVLTNSRTISAAENFVMAMRVIPGVTIIGDVTAGAMADTLTLPIDGGWTFTVPINVVRDAEGVCWEGVGLAPDLWAVNTPEGVAAGTDRVLELALALAGIDE